VTLTGWGGGRDIDGLGGGGDTGGGGGGGGLAGGGGGGERGGGGGGGAHKMLNFCEFFGTRFRSSNRRWYFGSLLRELGVTSVVIMGMALNWYIQ